MKTKPAQPIVLPQEIVDFVAACGLPDGYRAEKNCIAYAEGTMSKAEFIEMYQSGSVVYQDKCDHTIIDIWKAMKWLSL
jgi:hypothetical protein